MRVISGEFGGRRLQAPEGLATRPTTDKVRQAVFNSLGHFGVIEGAVVADLYAGSGALGIEALSRGAERCVFVERDRSALLALRANIAAFGLADRTTVVSSDVLAWVVAMRGIDVAFIDPPYAFDAWERLLGVVDATTVVAESGTEVSAPTGWAVIRAKRYGRTWVTVLERVA
ncbi:MAG: 16S rRNA (guanine(966)-N(2))-methyltransferase RsmD [Ilumatobacteraceae bacterium]